MKLIIIFVAIIILKSTSADATFIDMKRNHSLGIIKDSTENANIEDAVIQKFDSVKTETNSVYYSGLPKIELRYSFTEFPCLKLFFFIPDLTVIPNDLDKTIVLFNACNQNIYFFDGDNIENFSNVMGAYIAKLNSREKILDFIKFYLNTKYVYYRISG